MRVGSGVDRVKIAAGVMVAGALLVAGGCSGATAPAADQPPAPADLSASSASTTSSDGPAAADLTRRCSDAIAIISDPSRAVSNARFLDIESAADIGRDELTPDADGALTIHKFVLQVPRGNGALIISVAPSDRATVGLSYEPQQWAAGVLSIDDASQRVSVERCPDGDAQYNGGLIVKGPRCVRLQVQDRGSSAWLMSLPFGTTTCA